MSHRAGTCVHFNGTQHDCCEAGVNYKSLTKEVKGLPCMAKYAKPDGAVCDKRQEPTAEQIAASEAAFKASCDRLEKCIPFIQQIKANNKGKSNSGVDDCPVCGGRLHWSIAGYNGHVHAKCETADCIGFME